MVVRIARGHRPLRPAAGHRRDAGPERLHVPPAGAGVVPGQPLAIKNSDQTLHNIHGYKGPSTLFNQAEIPGMAPITRKLTDADQM